MEISLSGNVKDSSLARLLVHLNRQRKTGTLSIVTPVFTKKVYFSQGDVVFASSTYPDDRLGEMLLKADKITVEQYDKSVEVLKASKNKRQGAILVELGFIAPKDLFWGVKYQVREIIHSLFQIENAEYDFVEGEIPSQEVITLKMSIGNLIYTGAKRMENWTRIRSEMPPTDSVVKLSDDPLSLFQDIELTSQDKKILSLIDGRKTIKDIIENSWMGSFEALKILYVLWSIGIVVEKPAAAAGEPVEEEAPAVEEVSLSDIARPVSEEEAALLKKIEDVFSRLDTMKMHELLEVGEKSDDSDVKRNYYRLAREFHPDRYFAITDESIKTELTKIFDAVTKAYNSLKDPKDRAAYFESLKVPKRKKKAQEPSDAAKAEEQFKKGISEFKKGNFWGAVENFKWATKLDPSNPNYHNYLSLAYSRMPGRLKEAEEAISAAIKLQPENADFISNLGLIYLRAGAKKRAGSQFEKALELDPGNEKAKKGLEQSR